MPEIDERLSAARDLQQAGQWSEAAEAWRQCIWRAPGHAERPLWFLAYGEALIAAGELNRGLSILSGASRLFPARVEAPLALAQAYERRDAQDRAAPAWLDVIARVSAHRDRSWWLSSAIYGVIEGGDLDAAEELCRQALAEFPQAPGGHAMLSIISERRFAWGAALEHVDQAISRSAAHDRPALIVSKLRILREMGEVVAGRMLLRDELAAMPDDIRLLIAAADLAWEQGPQSEVAAQWKAIVARHPDLPEAHLGLARINRATGQLLEAESILRTACSRWPAHAGIRQALAEFLAQRRDMVAARREWEEARRLAPLSLSRLWAQCAFLGATGARQEAEALLADRGAAGVALWRGRLEFAKAARELDAALACLAALRAISPGSGFFAFEEADIRSWRQEEGDLEAAAALLRELLQRAPRSVRTSELLARVLVLQGAADEAGALIAAVPAAEKRRGISEARLWNAARQGHWPAVADGWTGLAQRVFLPALHLPRAVLAPVSQPFAPKGGTLVYGVIRNELPRLAGFLAHHRKLGVEGFVIIDNGSEDGSRAFLAAEPDVLLYSTSESFAQAQFGMRWVNQLLDLHGTGWAVLADADERLVFPGSEDRPLADLTAYLDARGEQAVAAVMIDLFPRQFRKGDGGAQSWFDPLRIRPAIACPYVEAAGGVRRRLFGTTVSLTKAPLIKAGAGVRYLGNHTITPAPVSAVTAALLHDHLGYVLDASQVKRVEEEVARGEHADYAVDRRRALGLSSWKAGHVLAGPESQAYAGSRQLVALGLMQTTKDFEKTR